MLSLLNCWNVTPAIESRERQLYPASGPVVMWVGKSGSICTQTQWGGCVLSLQRGMCIHYAAARGSAPASIETAVVCYRAGPLILQASIMTDTKVDFSGKWTVYKSDNFEQILHAAGANWLARKLGSNLKSTIVIKQDGDRFDIKFHTLVFNREESYVVGEEFEETQLDGNVYKGIAKWEDGKVIIEYTPKEEGKGQHQLITREIVDGELRMSFVMGETKGSRYFKKEKDI